MAQTPEQILQIDGVSKRYGGVLALNNVQFDLRYGEVHALVGENGAGKSTLIKVLGGIVPRDGGRITYLGRDVVFNTPGEAQDAGISIIHQELSMIPDLSVMENLFMHNMSKKYGVIDWNDMRRRCREALALVELDLDPGALMKDLPISQRQMIEIARALSSNAKLIVMDEPNSSLSEAETERLFSLIGAMKEQGIAIIYVSHKIDEVLTISDRITVFRDGGYVDTIPAAGATQDMVIRLMVGRELDRSAVPDPSTVGDVLLEVHNLCGKMFKNVSFDVRRGEVVALSGLIGAGRSEVMRAVFGADRYTSGEMVFEGKRVRFRTPADAISHGIAMVQEDRKVLSLFMDQPIEHNISVAQLPFMTRTGTINEGKERGLVQEFVRALDIRLASVEESGQQPQWRQPAENGAGALAGDQAEAAHPRRTDARRGRGRKGRNL